MPTCSLALVPIRCRPAPCEKVMLSLASVDHRFTGTDSSMKLRRLSVSEPFCRWGGGFGGRDRAPPSMRFRKSPSGFSGRVNTEGEIKLPLILSPIDFGRNDCPAHAVLERELEGLAWVWCVGDLPDRAAGVVADVDGAVGALGQTDWPVGLGASPAGLRGGGKAISEGGVRAGRPAESEGREYHPESSLGKRCAVPRPVEGHECCSAVLGWKLAARVEEHPVGGPVPRKGHQRLGLGRALPGFPAIAAVFGREHEAFAVDIMVAVRPSVIGAPVDQNQLLTGILGVFFYGKQTRPAVVEPVAPVNRRVEAAVQHVARERDGISDTGGEATAIGLPLPEASGVELPDTGAGIELGAGVISRRSSLPAALLASVRGGADVDVESAPIDHEIVRMVRAAHRQAGYDRVRTTGRSKRSRRDAIAHDRGAGSSVEIVVGEGNPRPAGCSEAFLQVGFAIAIGVSQSDNATAAWLSVHEHIAVRG